MPRFRDDPFLAFILVLAFFGFIFFLSQLPLRWKHQLKKVVGIRLVEIEKVEWQGYVLVYSNGDRVILGDNLPPEWAQDELRAQKAKDGH